jgi:hypothetical protein
MFLLLSLLACEAPYGVASVSQVTPEGLQVSVILSGVSEAQLAGQTVRDGDTIQVPMSQLKVGINDFPFEGADFDQFSRLQHDLAPNEALQPQCGPEKTWISVQGEPEYSYEHKFSANHCGILGGEIAVPVSLHGQVKAEIEGGRVQDGVLLFPLGVKAYEQVLSTQGSFGSGNVAYKSKLTLTYPDGSSWSQDLEVNSREPAVGPFFDGLPATLLPLERSASEVNTLAVFEAGGRYWATGMAQGKTLSQADLYVKAGKKGEEKDFKTCNFRTMQGGNFSAKAKARSQEFIAFDAAGKEIARTTLEVGGCPGNVSLKDGETLVLVPGQSQVQSWVEGLL